MYVASLSHGSERYCTGVSTKENPALVPWVIQLLPAKAVTKINMKGKDLNGCLPNNSTEANCSNTQKPLSLQKPPSTASTATRQVRASLPKAGFELPGIQTKQAKSQQNVAIESALPTK